MWLTMDDNNDILSVSQKVTDGGDYLWCRMEKDWFA